MIVSTYQVAISSPYDFLERWIADYSEHLRFNITLQITVNPL